MDTTLIVILALVAVLIVGGAVLYAQRRNSHQMRARYGSEYIAAVDQAGGRRRAEAELRHREKRVEAFDLRPLPPREAAAFADDWRRVQADFVDDPGLAIDRADDLLSQLMRARGYPASAFEQRAADLSVHHPRLVSDYRIAHEVAQRHTRGEASTEDLRKAMIHYRALFDDLLAPSAQDRRPEEPRTFTSEEAYDERAARARDEREYPDDRAARERGRVDGDGRAPHV